MSADREQVRRDAERFLRDSGYEEFVPGIPDAPLRDWGTLGWARAYLALLAELEQAERREAALVEALERIARDHEYGAAIVAVEALTVYEQSQGGSDG